MKTYEELKTLFLTANRSLLVDDKDLFIHKVSERSLCGALMLHLNRAMLQSESFEGYYTDIEYNRNCGNLNRNSSRAQIKTIRYEDGLTDNITCDLIMHSRGKRPEQDNLIAIEMKKTGRPSREKNDDKNRLKALTKDTFNDDWSYDGVTLPEHVCRYVIGIYYEINFETSTIYLEYYRQGERIERQSIRF